MFSSFIVFLTAVSISASNHGQIAIINGKEIKPNKFPSIVSIRHYDVHKCGGVVIGPQTVLTAGHCIIEEEYMSVHLVSKILDEKEPVIYEVLKAKKQPHFAFLGEKRKPIHDIGIISVRSSEQLLSMAAKLPEENCNYTMDTSIIVAGWGATKRGVKVTSNTLRQIEMRMIPKIQCRDELHATEQMIGEEQFCAKTRHMTTCYGDSGSPAMIGNTLVGIVSWGRKCNPEYPVVFLRVDKYLIFISHNS